MRLRTPFLATALAVLAPSASAAAQTLYTDSISYCSPSRAVVVNGFDFTYHRSNNSLVFAFAIAAQEANLNLQANLYANAYGMDLFNETLSLCDFLSGVICPLPQLNISGVGTYPLPQQYSGDIPALAWTVPDLDAYARIQLISVDSGQVESCVQFTLSNGLTARQNGVSWGTGMFTLVAILIALFHTMVNSSSPAQYRWFDILFLYQTAAATGLLHLNYPVVYNAFSQNFFWAIGMFYNANWEQSINNMRYKTGGTLPGTVFGESQRINGTLSANDAGTAVNITQIINSGIFTSNSGGTGSASALGRRSADLVARVVSPSSALVNGTSQIITGIPLYVNSLGIPAANAFTTLFFVMLIFIAAAIALHILLFPVVLLFKRATWAGRLRRGYWSFSGGNALRICLIFFFPVWIFAFFQFQIRDSRLAIFLAVFSILLTFAPLAIVFILSLRKSRRPSSTSPGVSPLYTSYRWFHSVGVLYRPYRTRFHFFWFIIVLAMIARAAFTTFGGRSGWVQVIGNMVVEFILLVTLLGCRPHKDRKGDWLAPLLSFIRLAVFGLLVAFIPAVGVRAIPRTIIGFVIIALFGIATVLLLIGLIFNAGYGLLWRRRKHRIEEGLEVDKFVAADADDDSGSQRPAMMQHVDASNFVSSQGAMASRHNSSGHGHSIGRRTSIIEPVSPDQVYEPSNTSHGHGHGHGNGHSYSGNDNHQTYYAGVGAHGAGNINNYHEYDDHIDNRLSSYSAYDAAARGGHGYGEATSPPMTRATSPIISSGHGHGYGAGSRHQSYHSSGRSSGHEQFYTPAGTPGNERRWPYNNTHSQEGRY